MVAGHARSKQVEPWAQTVRMIATNDLKISDLKLLRLIRGMSLDELGRLVGVSGSYLSRLERGYARPKPDLLAAIVRALSQR